MRGVCRLLVAASLTCWALISFAAGAVRADEALQNGSFDLGMTGWPGADVSCPQPRSGLALSIVIKPNTSASVSQSVFATQHPLPPGTYTLSGFINVLSGQVDPRIRLTMYFAGASLAFVDDDLTTSSLTSSGGYVPFHAILNTNRSDVTSLIVQLMPLAIGATDARVCFDDLSLSVPNPPPPTPIPTFGPPTATFTPAVIPAAATWTPVADGTATRTPTSTRTPTATRTPRPGETPEPTQTPVSGAAATRTPTPLPGVTSTPPLVSATSTPSSMTSTAPSYLLLNPGFEEGQAGWSKYGGDFTVFSGIRHGGVLSGQITSATASTKWVYQTVVIDPASAYEFSGWLRPQGDIKAAYLRISWYASFDGSGSALATDDSTARLGGPSNEFAYFTTGPVAPPPGARSARVRALLGPLGASFATLFMDDFAFVPAGPAAALLQQKTLQPDEDEESEQAEPTPRPKTTPQPTRTPRPDNADARQDSETPVIVRAVATRSRPIAPQLNSDGIETTDPPPPMTNVLLLDNQPSGNAPPVDHRFAILLGAFLLSGSVLVAAYYIKRPQS